MSSQEGWTTNKGYSIPPPADSRNIVNEPMKFGPVRTGQNTMPGSGTPQVPIDTPETPTPEPEIAQKTSTEVLADIPPPFEAERIPAASKFTGTQAVRIEWQGCTFNVTFDDVWLQSDPVNPDTPKWLVLVHDLNQNAGGPTWTPPVSIESSEPTTLTISYKEYEYVCSYFGLELLIPACNLSLTTFLVLDKV